MMVLSGVEGRFERLYAHKKGHLGGIPLRWPYFILSRQLSAVYLVHLSDKVEYAVGVTDLVVVPRY